MSSGSGATVKPSGKPRSANRRRDGGTRPVAHADLHLLSREVQEAKERAHQSSHTLHETIEQASQFAESLASQSARTASVDDGLRAAKVVIKDLSRVVDGCLEALGPDATIKILTGLDTIASSLQTVLDLHDETTQLRSAAMGEAMQLSEHSARAILHHEEYEGSLNKSLSAVSRRADNCEIALSWSASYVRAVVDERCKWQERHGSNPAELPTQRHFLELCKTALGRLDTSRSVRLPNEHTNRTVERFVHRALESEGRYVTPSEEVALLRSVLASVKLPATSAKDAVTLHAPTVFIAARELRSTFTAARTEIKELQQRMDEDFASLFSAVEKFGRHKSERRNRQLNRQSRTVSAPQLGMSSSTRLSMSRIDSTTSAMERDETMLPPPSWKSPSLESEEPVPLTPVAPSVSTATQTEATFPTPGTAKRPPRSGAVGATVSLPPAHDEPVEPKVTPDHTFNTLDHAAKQLPGGSSRASSSSGPVQENARTGSAEGPDAASAATPAERRSNATSSSAGAHEETESEQKRREVHERFWDDDEDGEVDELLFARYDPQSRRKSYDDEDAVASDAPDEPSRWAHDDHVGPSTGRPPASKPATKHHHQHASAPHGRKPIVYGDQERAVDQGSAHFQTTLLDLGQGPRPKRRMPSAAGSHVDRVNSKVSAALERLGNLENRCGGLEARVTEQRRATAEAENVTGASLSAVPVVVRPPQVPAHDRNRHSASARTRGDPLPTKSRDGFQTWLRSRGEAV